MPYWIYECRVCKSGYNDDGDVINRICLDCEDTPEAEEIYRQIRKEKEKEPEM